MEVFFIKGKIILSFIIVLSVFLTLSVVSAISDDCPMNSSDNYSSDNNDYADSYILKDDNKTVKKSTNKHSSKIKVENVNVNYSDTALLKATVVDKTLNTYINGGKVLFKVNGISIGYSNIKNGKAFLKYNTSLLTAKDYNISVVYGGNSSISSYRANATLKVNKLSSIITLSNVNAKTNTSVNIKALLKDSKGRSINGGYVVFKINDLTVKSVNVSNGFADFNYVPDNIVKNYTITAKYSGTSRYSYASNTSKLIVSLRVYSINWASKGNIKSNKVLYNNLTKSSITDDLIKTSLNSTSYVCLGDGKGKTVFIVSGIHGNELSSQSACVKLINDLSTKSIHGSVYIFPFVAPSYTGNNTRSLNGVNLNSVAHKSGTISNKVYLFAKSKNAVCLGDFHCTMPGGKPGCNAVFGSYNPTSSSATLAKYISSKTSSKSIIYNKAGTEYPGALEDYCNLNGITSVTCEVKTPHGSIATGSVEKSYNMMKSLLTYYDLI